MIGTDPFGQEGLDDLQREGLRTRQEAGQPPRDPSDEDVEPQTLNEAHWWVQPKWVKYLTWIVGAPVGLFWAYEIKFGDIFALDSRLVDVCFGVLFLIAAVQLFFVFRAYWRMDI